MAPSETTGDSILLTSVRPNELERHKDSLSQIDANVPTENALVPLDSVDRINNFGSLGATTGTFDAETVNSTLRERYGESGTYKGYSLYVLGNTVAFGVADGVFLKSRTYDGADVEQNLKDLIDTGEGDLSRLHEVNDAGKALVDTLGDGTFIRMNSTTDLLSPPGEVMGGSEISLGEAESEFKAALVFESADAVDRDLVRAAVEERVAGEELDTVSVSTNDRTVVASGSVPNEDLTALQFTFT